MASSEFSRAEESSTTLDDIVVSGRGDVLLGTADSANQGTVGAKELKYRPLARPGEVLETVPGMIITQHAGSGKANQYYLRGFNLDHGTDFAFYVDGVPVNLPSHAHGQGYADLNWLIPELVKGVTYEKGPFYADQGDFANAGSASISYFSELPYNFAKTEGGTLGYARELVAGSPVVGAGHLLYGLEASRYDGAWDAKQNAKKFNGVSKYTVGSESAGYSLEATAYHNDWYGNEQVPERALLSGLIGRYGTLDRSTGGVTSRFGLNGEWHRQNEEGATKILLYVNRYDLDLFSDFNFYKDDPVNGDQFEQKDGRMYAGERASHTFYGKLAGHDTESTVGFQTREDWIQLHLNHTVARQILSETRFDRVSEMNIAPYLENKTRWADWYRTVVGLRGDYFQVNSASSNALNSGTQSATAVSPKLSMTFGPWSKTEYYVSGGMGLRTNDARGVISTVKPDNTGSARQLPLIVRSRGAEVGVRTNTVKDLNSTLSFWLLDNSSDTFFSADSGTITDADRSSRRLGVEWTNFYAARPWLTIDADFALSQARFTDNDPTGVGKYVPDSVTSVVASGVTAHDVPLLGGYFGSLRFRYFGPRPLIENNSQKSAPSAVFNVENGYNFNKTWTAAFAVLNLTNAKYNDNEYFYANRLKTEAAGPDDGGGYNDHQVHPGEPRSIRGTLTARF